MAWPGVGGYTLGWHYAGCQGKGQEMIKYFIYLSITGTNGWKLPFGRQGTPSCDTLDTVGKHHSWLVEGKGETLKHF